MLNVNDESKVLNESKKEVKVNKDNKN